MLARRGAYAKLKIGVAGGIERFKAHAWLECPWMRSDREANGYVELREAASSDAAQNRGTTAGA